MTGKPLIDGAGMPGKPLIDDAGMTGTPLIRGAGMTLTPHISTAARIAASIGRARDRAAAAAPKAPARPLQRHHLAELV